MSEEVANQSEESPIEVEHDADTEALYESFGMPAQKQEKKDIEFPKMDEPTDPLTMEEETEDEHKETPNDQAEKRTIKVKYLGEDKDVGEDEAPAWIQKGMNHDRLQEKLTEQQKALDEVAQLQGFKDHSELLANLPKLREQQQQKTLDQFEQAKQKIIDDLVYNGVDEEAAREYAENNPLVQQARASMEREQLQEQERQIQLNTQQRLSSWDELYKAFPDIVAESDKFNTSERPDFFTPEMERMYNAGYKPLDAYKLAHLDKIQTQTKRSTEQRLIKEQQLGVRSAAAGQAPSMESEVSLLPIQMGLAEEFGVSIKGVQRQSQILKNRR